MFNDSKFYLWQDKSNLNNYEIRIVAAYLHVDVCTINNKARLDFDRMYITEKRPVTYHYNGKISVLQYDWRSPY
jgi:hypothetical protein